MTDAELTTRPGKGWTQWKCGTGAAIWPTWWAAKELHFPKLNVTVYFDGSTLVGIEDWGARPTRWTMRKPGPDWQPMPEGYREAAEREWLAWQSCRRLGVISLSRDVDDEAALYTVGV